ncbi:SRPBCC family protein [Streptomyces sp. NPDC046275]|uniref:SRPBCC family protein n=1 Tax=Streptomyces sp. NPDC046275 TaxID=3157201 RepID=UPI0033D53337
MEHEVFVPVPAEVLRDTLTDPARVARCVPGFQQDADGTAGPFTGRLKIRVGGNTITYRGALRLAERDGRFAVEGEGTEVRGKGTAELALTLALTPVAEGTTIGFTGRVTAAGRLAEADAEARAQAGARLLDRFAEALAAVSDVAAEVAAEEAAEEAAKAARAAEAAGAAEADSDDDGVDDGVEEPARPSVFDTPVPPPSLDPLADADFDRAEAADGEDDGDGADGDEYEDEYEDDETAGGYGDEDGALAGDAAGAGAGAGERAGGGQPAEAAHARRTMIGRSAEEVDHAPPRGRYAPVPAAEAAGSGATLRWIAPAAALALASAVVVGRALRRRRG